MWKNRPFQRTVTIDSPAAGTKVMWRADAACKVLGVRVYRVGGSAAAVNVIRRRATTNVDLLAADLSAATADGWSSTTTVQNGTLAAGDTLIGEVVSVGGSPTQLVIQVDLRYDANA